VSFLLDTNVVSELRKGERASTTVVQWFAGVADRELFLSVLVIGELRQGVERIRRRDINTAEHLDRWLRVLLDDHEGRILPVDGRVADLWGRLNVPDPVPAVDGLLAATAIVHDLTLVTRNARDVARTGARLLDPFSL
jgi:predicted nucleic acid-binding protein